MASLRQFRQQQIFPPYQMILRRLGYRKNHSELTPQLEETIRNEIDFARKIMHPAGNTLDIQVSDVTADAVLLKNGLMISSKNLARVMAGSKKATLMLCTIGKELEEESIREMKSGNLTRAVILDAIGSETVEEFANYINGILEQENKLFGLKPTLRYSPGYGDLSIDIHTQILPLLEHDKLGVGYHPESYILSPQKTISAIIGWYR